jgi:hypothetical protein
MLWRLRPTKKNLEKDGPWRCEGVL